jgi:Domain of unknown function (DUF4386)
MSAAAMTKRFAEVSPRFKARIAGGLFLLILLTAASTEFFVRGKLSYAVDLAAGLVEVLCYLSVTLLFYDLFKPVNRGLSLLAMSLNLVGLALEAFQWQPHGVLIGMVLHGFYCILIGYLIFRSTYLPRILGALMALAGLCWLTYLSAPLVNYLSPYHLACGLLGEASLCLWLLVMGVNAQRWKEQAGVQAEWRT